MQMSCIVWEPSDWFRWGAMVRKSEVIGNHWRSSAVGSCRSIKKGHLSCYYTIVKSELIGVNKEVVVEKNDSGAVRRRQPERMRIKK